MNGMMSARMATALLVLVAMAGAAGCHNARIHYTGANKYLPRPANYPIAIVEGNIEDPYEILGTVETRTYKEWEAEERATADLAAAARRAGGDAVIDVRKVMSIGEEGGYRPTNTWRVGSRVITVHRYTGKIVRYRRDQMDQP